MSDSTPRDGQSKTAFARMALMTALLTSCGNEATVPIVPPVAQLVTVQLTMDVPSFPGLTPSAAHVVFTRGNGDVALDTTLSLNLGSAAASGLALAVTEAAAAVNLNLDVPFLGDHESFTIEVEVLDEAEAPLYATDPALTVSLSAANGPAVDVTLTYVGQGASAADVQITASDYTPAPGDVITLQAIVLDGSGNELFGVPLAWVALDSNLSIEGVTSEEGRSVATVLVGEQEGTYQIRATIPTAHERTTSIAVEEPPPIGIVRLDVDVPSFPGITPAWLRIQLARGDGSLAADTAIDLLSTSAAMAGLPAATAGMVNAEIEVELRETGEMFDADVQIQDSNFAPLYQTPAPMPIEPGDLPVEIVVNYVGTGSDAASVEILSDTDELVSGESAEVTAVVRDANGNELTDVPILWDGGTALAIAVLGSNGGRATATIVAGASEGTFSLTASTPTDVMGSTAFTISAPPPPETLIDFETWPDGSQMCYWRCPVSHEFSSMGVTFGFSGAIAAGGKGMPFINGQVDRSDHWLANDRNSSGALTGIIHMKFADDPREVQFELEAPAGVPEIELRVFGTDGEQLPESVIERSESVVGSWRYQHITIRVAGGISEVRAVSAQSIAFIDDLQF